MEDENSAPEQEPESPNLDAPNGDTSSSYLDEEEIEHKSYFKKLNSLFSVF